jgi:multidrug efflux system membrane fusion protein
VWSILVFLCVAGAAIYGAHRHFTPAESAGAGSGKPGEAAGGKPGGGKPSGGSGGGSGFSGPRSVPVVAAKAKRGDLPIYLDAPGTVVALNTVTVHPRVDGQIMKVNYTEGQTVQEGDLLVQIDPRPFQVQLTQAQGQLAKDQASLKNAKLDVARYQAAGKGATQQQVDTAKAAAAQFEGAVKTDQGQIDSANLQLTYCKVTAPIGGQIGLRLVDAGNVVHASDATGLVVITQIEPITVLFSLAEDFLPQVMKANSGEQKLTVEVRNRDRRVLLATGSLLAVDGQIDLVTLTARFKAIFDNKDHALFPNQAVNVRLLVDTKKDAVLVPSAALQRGPKTTFVYVVKEDKTVEVRDVKLGPTEGDISSVEENLAPDETVVIEGVDKLAPGMSVTMPGAEGADAKGGGEAHKHKGKPEAGAAAESKPAAEGKPEAGTAAEAASGSNPQPAAESKPAAEGKPEGGAAQRTPGGRRHKPAAEAKPQEAAASAGQEKQ